MKNLLIIGNGKVAELAYFFLREKYNISAFVSDKENIDRKNIFDIPVVPIEEIENTHPSGDHVVMIAIGYRRLNSVRSEKYHRIKKMGYEIITYVHESAYVADNAVIGEGSIIFPGCIIEPFSTIGNNVVVWSGTLIGHHSHIEGDCFFAARALVSGCCYIGKSSFIGNNATILNAVTLGEYNIVGAGTIVDCNTAPDTIHRATASRMSNVPARKFAQKFL